MWRCVSSTIASLKKPRAMPDWFVTMTTRRPARLSARMASTVHGKERDPVGPVEIADVLDQRAVAIEKHRRLSQRSARAASSDRADTLMPRMQR